MQTQQVRESKMFEYEPQGFMSEQIDFELPQPVFTLFNEENLVQQEMTPSQIKANGRAKGDKKSNDKVKKNKMILNQQNRKKGHWSVEENKRYHWFLQIYSRHFICKEMRRLDKIFKTMAIFIGSREAQQCRSHHQKMEKKYISFPSILLYLRKFHYKSQESRFVQQDMIKNQVKQSAILMHHKELQDLQLIKQVSTIHSFQEQQKVNYEAEEAQKQFQLQQNLLDLLGEDYEHRFEFDNFLI